MILSADAAVCKLHANMQFVLVQVLDMCFAGS